MSKIIELSESLANQIAAGEVVERPASVVKELLENSIDAGASKITVRVEEAGLRLIEIVDNGSGIESDDVQRALLRHATSKLKSASDLFRIRTLGFRGEALPSIAAVSELTIETSSADEAAGTRLVAKGGEIQSVEPFAKFDGTKISVANLFFNTPARLKYVRSLQSEMAHVTDIVNRESLAHPEISFTLYNEGNLSLQTAGTGDLRQAIAQVYGMNTARKLVHVLAEDLDFQLTGFVSLPELTRASRNYISIFLNGRYIKNFALNRAIVEGYGSKLMVGRFPLVVLQLTVDPQLVDVNVHPTKQEIRLSKEKELMALITSAIQEALSEETLIPQALENLHTPVPDVKPENSHKELIYDNSRQDFYVKEVDNSPYAVRQQQSFRQSQKIVQNPADEKFDVSLFESEPIKQKPDFSAEAVKGEHSPKQPEEEVPQSSQNPTFPELGYLAQLHATYLLCQAPDGFYLVDQHAAQERVKYEYWRDKIGEVSYDQQTLLAPILIDLPKDDFLRVNVRKTQLEEAGLYLEEYGASQFVLREHPIWMRDDEIESATYELIDLLLADKETSVKKYREDLAIMIACKSSIKAHDPIDPEGARSLLKQLALCENPYNCPHGRPAVVRFSNTEIEKMFRRIQASHQSARRNALLD
ncbi:MAG: DNA mismatch repair endonuclease MutL [Streptococcaceae bacterium]|jgi:DNA mismatch repair protein MutL|nr:DNA mismatch repair endonuclease MutL [Streptococcaceae bacterium]